MPRAGSCGPDAHTIGHVLRSWPGALHLDHAAVELNVGPEIVDIGVLRV
jgi:hypothetical protein